MATIEKATFAGTKLWSETSAWVGSSVPGVGDDVIFPNTEGNIEIAAAAKCRSLDCTNFKGTLTHKTAIALAIGTTTANASGFALRLGSGMTYTPGASSKIQFAGTFATTALTVLTRGIELAEVEITAANKIELADNFKASKEISVAKGELKSAGHEVTCLRFGASNANARTIDITNSTIKLTQTTGSTIWNMATTTNLTFVSTGSLIECTGLGTGLRKFAGGGQTYNNLTIPSGVDQIEFAGNATFNTLSIFNHGVEATRFEGGSTQTVTSLVVEGAGGIMAKLHHGLGEEGQWNISKASGTVTTVNKAEIARSAAIGGAAWYAQNSENGGENSGWKFEAVPSMLAMII